MSYNILGSGYRPNITLFSFDSASAKIHKVSDSKAPENASWLEPGKEGVFYSTSEVPKGEVFSLKLQGEELEITGKRSTKGEEPAHGTFDDVIRVMKAYKQFLSSKMVLEWSLVTCVPSHFPRRDR